MLRMNYFNLSKCERSEGEKVPRETRDLDSLVYYQIVYSGVLRGRDKRAALLVFRVFLQN